jgi:hypothetical protein
MLTVDDLISFGYWRKHYHTVREDYIQANAYSKDAINQAVKATQTAQDDPKTVRTQMEQANSQVAQEAILWAREVIQIAIGYTDHNGKCWRGLDGLSLEEVRLTYSA